MSLQNATLTAELESANEQLTNISDEKCTLVSSVLYYVDLLST